MISRQLVKPTHGCGEAGGVFSELEVGGSRSSLRRKSTYWTLKSSWLVPQGRNPVALCVVALAGPPRDGGLLVQPPQGSWHLGGRLHRGVLSLRYAVAQGIDDFHDGEISVRFQLLGGSLDQCAGILFNLKPNGDYLAVRFNGKEDNLVLWIFDKGKRSFVKKGVKDVHIPYKEWHSIKIAVHGTQLEGWLDGEHLLDYTLAAPVSGKVGVWSKTDSISEFADYVVVPAGR